MLYGKEERFLHSILSSDQLNIFLVSPFSFSFETVRITMRILEKLPYHCEVLAKEKAILRPKSIMRFVKEGKISLR